MRKLANWKTTAFGWAIFALAGTFIYLGKITWTEASPLFLAGMGLVAASDSKKQA